MDFYTQKYSEFIVYLNNEDKSAFPDSAFVVSENETLSSGHSISGIFCHSARTINDNTLSRICDFIIYENSKNRKPCIAVDEPLRIHSVITERLKQHPKPTFVRKSDPTWIVHATNAANGNAIIADGIIKSQKLLIAEGYLSGYQLGFTQNSEPLDYLDHINFAVMDSIWSEAVVSSNQSGTMGDFDTMYEPGYRFYINAHDLIKSGLVIRTGAPFLKVVGELNLNKIINYPVCYSLFENKTWTPRTFTDSANDIFQNILLKIPTTFHNIQYVASRIPGVLNESDFSLGANCQLFAYNLLRHFGFNPPALRSSELWADSDFTTMVNEINEFDIMLYNNSQKPFGAHVGIYVGGGIVYHLSKDNAFPKFEKHTELLKQRKYRFFIGAKRVYRG